MHVKIVFVAVLMAAAGAEVGPENRGRHNDPTDSYEVRQVEGWKVYVSARLLAEKDLAADTLSEVEIQLHQLGYMIPSEALKKLRDVPIWVELDNWDRCQYHPSGEWLSKNNYNPDKAGAVEVSNARSFIEWVRERGILVLLHELAHAYHHRVLGHDNAAVLDAYKAAVEGKAYEQVLRDTGGKVRHYALENSQEYFAELTESYFTRNDYYPFIRVELLEHDPGGHEMCRKLWGGL